MHPDDRRFLENQRTRILEKISLLTDPGDERRFREWAMSATAPQPGERVQGSRDTWQAERMTDLMLKYRGERERRILVLKRELDRLEKALRGEVAFLSPTAALKWCRE